MIIPCEGAGSRGEGLCSPLVGAWGQTAPEHEAAPQVRKRNAVRARYQERVEAEPSRESEKSQALLAANSDAQAQSLEIYAAVKQHADKVPGLAVANSDLSVFFQHTKRKTATPTPVTA